MKQPKTNDVYYWSYNNDELEKLGDVNNGGTTYWCCSRLCIFDGERFVDTFWGSYGSNKSWSQDQASEQLELEFIANMDDLINADPSERAYYKDSDCVNLNHSNSIRGNFYIRVGATKDIDKMSRILKRGIKEVKSEIASQIRSIKQMEESLVDISEDTRMLSIPNGLSLYDEDWRYE